MGKNVLINKKKFAFTLVELLAVIIILGVLALIVYPAVNGSINSGKEKAYDIQVSEIIGAARKWGIENIDQLNETTTTRVYLNQLIENGYITKTKEGVLYNPKDNSIMNGCVIISYSTDYNQYIYEYDSECKEEYVDNSGANKPELYDKMIPVIWDGINWVYADIYEKWYDYDTKEWANAVVLNGGVTKVVGNTISESEIAMMYVWIPRYKYTIFNGNNGSKPIEEIDVVFESGTAKTGTVKCTTVTAGSGSTSEDCGTVTNGSSTYTHPAFTFGSTSLTGFWVGKFEVSSSNPTTNSVQTVLVKPNVQSWRNAQVATFYTSIQNITSEYGLTNTDSHMMKNMEWGAVAYLKQSKYGLGTTDIGINNNNGYITGCGASSGSSSTSSCNTYNTSNGMLASTTGNIYGVYDMSGGAYEYVMGNMVTSSNVPMVGWDASIESNFKGLRYNGTYNTSGYDFPASKYYDAYTNDTSSNMTHSRGKLGDATKETLSTYGSSTGGWTSDYASFPHSVNPWFRRGGWYSRGANAGVFTFVSTGGNADMYSSTRVVVSSV